MIVGVPKEVVPGERRVALVPAVIPPLTKAGLTVRVEAGAGADAGYTDEAYREKGAEIADRDAVLAADIVVAVNAGELAASLRSGATLIGFMDPLGNPQRVQQMAQAGLVALAMETIPRITRAQSMDALSSMATIAGYKAVLLAASELPRMFPMMMTAAGTISPAKVFVVGAGVAGLQALATAKRLGAKTEGYDVRPAVKDQVVSVGAKFVEFDLDTGDAEDKGGYAKEQSEEFLRRQREQMGQVVARNDVVITTAAIPGKRSPVLVTEDMVKAMEPGSVIVDLAAERGGNCELTKAGERVVAHGVTILGPLNLPATVPYHASQMYAKNVQTLLSHLIKDGQLVLDTNDEITAGTLLCRDGQVVHERIKALLGG
ncbi:MAG: Re/Si-specific NAD(P)(+) transhydrogenase subunit alpha [Deltaproteobacteria bacterium]|nr:MAG: Re/Si-specific NAD(P)(+) transhydrogenase subunit alpha [Deltaproteobacteria bacterium]